MWLAMNIAWAEGRKRSIARHLAARSGSPRKREARIVTGGGFFRAALAAEKNGEQRRSSDLFPGRERTLSSWDLVAKS